MKPLHWIVVSLIVCQSGFAQDAAPPPAQLQYSRWSGKLNVPDPVAICFDNLGTAYVTQTQRRKSQDLDIRANSDWVTADVGFQSVDDKRNFYHQQLAPGEDQERNRKRVDDLNGDGSHDWHDLTVISEKIHWLRDGDGDGTADTMGLFAEDFQTEVTGIAAGVLWRGGDLFATIAPDVWRLRDTDGDLTADTREVFATGFGLHIAYAGHDMHGLTVGPDGKIYWTVGDKGIAVTSREGKKFQFPNQGGVLRCDPDGSNFEVFAHGLRNVQELAFDAYGNLFGVDNDADQPDEKERFIYIVRDMDAGWRCNYQYRGSDYNPWTAERLWMPHFDGQASYILPPLSNYIDGPAGFAFNPGTALSSAYRDHFFLTGAPNGYQYAFKVRTVGASFAMQGEHQIGQGIPLVGINFAPDGALYGVDWGGGYPLNQTGAVWKIDVAESDLQQQRVEVATRLREGFAKLSVSDLTALLGHADQRIRLGGQFELVARKELAALIDALSSSNEMTQVHAIWGLGQLARSGDQSATQAMLKVLDAKQPELRAQAARTLSDVANVAGESFVKLLDDNNDRVRFMAAIALSKHPASSAVEKLLAISNELTAAERYLRFAVSRALAACATPAQLSGAARTSSQVGKLNLVVALRSTASTNALAGFLADDDVQVAIEAARALHDDNSDSAQLQPLARALDSTLHQDEAFLRRVLNANYRLGGAEELIRVSLFSAKRSSPQPVRVEALSMLASWPNPDPLDRVDGRRRQLEQGRAIDRVRLEALLSSVALHDDPTIQTAAVGTARKLNIRLSTGALIDLATSTKVDVNLRIESLRALEAQVPGVLANIIHSLIKDPAVDIRLAAAEALVQQDPQRAESHFIKTFDQSTVLRERQHAIRQLGKLSSDASAAFLTNQLARITEQTLPNEFTLDLLTAAANRAHDAAIQAALAKAQEAIAQAGAALPPQQREFIVCRDGGDPAAGEKLFQTHLAAQCVRCHKVGKQGSDVGPNLQGIASKRDRDYLLRSVVAPSADIDEKYQSLMILDANGNVQQGVLIKETDTEVIIADSQGKEIRIDRNVIELMKTSKQSIMPAMTETLTREEIRDLVAYLATLKK